MKSFRKFFIFGLLFALALASGCQGGTAPEMLELKEVKTVSSYAKARQPHDYSADEIAGARYFFSSSTGSDKNAGTKDAPFASLDKIKELDVRAGDGVYLKCGDVFENQALTLQACGTAEKPITIASYGTGDYPILYGGGVVYDKVLSLVPTYTARVGVNLINATGVQIMGLAVHGAEFGVWSRGSAEAQPFVLKDCEFRDIWGYRCIRQEELSMNIGKPVYSNALVLMQNHSDITIQNCRFYDCEAGMHVGGMKKGGNFQLEDIVMDNMFREGVLLESILCPENAPGSIKNCSITNTGCVHGMFWGVTALQFNVCENIVCEDLDLSYTGNGDYRLDMTGGDYEATNANIVVKNSRIHDNGGSAWLTYKNPSWGKDNRNTSLENCEIYNNGLQNTQGFPAFIRHYFNAENGGTIKNNQIWLADEGQKVNYIDPVTSNEYPAGYEVSGNVIKGVYTPPAIEMAEGVVQSFEFDKAYALEEFYGFLNAAWAYPNGNYLYIKPRSNDSRSEQCEVISKDRLGLDLTGVTKIVVRLKNKTAATRMKFAFNTPEDYNFSDTNAVTFPVVANDIEFTEYTLDVGDFFAARGSRIDRIKIYPCLDTLEGWAAIDYIRFVK